MSTGRVTRAQIEKAARTAGIPLWLFMAVVGQESGGRTGATSSAGARGPAQLMPGTAKRLEQDYGIDTSTPYGNLLGGAYYLAEQKKRFKHWNLALSAYNSGPAGAEAEGSVEGYSETQNYVANILAKAAQLKKQLGGDSGPSSVPTQLGSQSGVGGDSYEEIVRNGVRALSKGQYSPKEQLRLLMEAQGRQAVSGVTPDTPGASVAPSGPLKVSKWIKYPTPAGQWPGPGEEILRFAAQIGQAFGRPLTASDTSTHSRLTVNGNVSAHTTGDALDIPASGAKLIRLGRIALMQAGMPRKEAMKVRGGLFNVGGKQIIFNTQEGGDHTDHLHIGNRR